MAKQKWGFTTVARDSENKIMWIKGRTDLSPLTYREWREGRDMESGSIKKDGVVYPAPYTSKEEDLEVILYMAEEKKLREFNDRRQSIAKKLPELANRVFALRDKMYMGCGFHWALEKELGYIISVMNDFDRSYRDMADRIIVEVRYDQFLEKLEKAENDS